MENGSNIGIKKSLDEQKKLSKRISNCKVELVFAIT